MAADVVTAVAVKAEAVARGGGVVCITADNFDQSLEFAEEGRPSGIEIDQQRVVQECALVAMNQYRCFRSEWCFGVAVRNKAGGGLLPEQVVEAIGELGIRRIDIDAFFATALWRTSGRRSAACRRL